MATEARRPAFYALAPGGWRDYVTLLHAPYTAWHLSYVAIGAALAMSLTTGRLLLLLLAFFLAVGIGAHALDEWNGRPLGTRIPGRLLIGLAAVSIAAAIGIGIYGSVVYDPWIAIFVVCGGFIVVAYNLELFGGRFHTDLWFAAAWGSFPLLTAYYAVDGRLTGVAALGSVFAFALSFAQRKLSTPVRDIRRRALRVEGTVERADGSVQRISTATLTEPAEVALRALTVSVIAIAVALVIMRLT